MAYHPLEIRDSILKILDGKKLKHGTLTPWYKGFSGKIERNKETGQVVMTGKLEVVNSTTIRITELPIGMYLDQYKDHLHKLEGTMGIGAYIKDYEDRSTEDAFDFTITVPRSTTALSTEELYKKFKLISRDTENFTLWNEKGVIEKFSSAEAIIERFVTWRLARYEDRRQLQIKETMELIRWMSEKLRFILFYLDHVNDFKGKKKEDLVALLLKNKFVDYERLLSMTMWNLTKDKIEELKKEIGESTAYLEKLKLDCAGDMYYRELKEFKYP